MRNRIKTFAVKVTHNLKKEKTIRTLEIKKEFFFPIGPITRRIETQTVYR